MATKTERIAETLIIELVLFLSVMANLRPAFVETNSGGEIDLFTQKEPYSGKDPNIPSDAFDPEEEVIIYALVAYNDHPVAMVPVAFEVHGPENSIYNITFFDYAQTDDSGIAKISFKIGSVK